jgi:hypothetical protein
LRCCRHALSRASAQVKWAPARKECPALRRCSIAMSRVDAGSVSAGSGQIAAVAAPDEIWTRPFLSDLLAGLTISRMIASIVCHWNFQTPFRPVTPRNRRRVHSVNTSPVFHSSVTRPKAQLADHSQGVLLGQFSRPVGPSQAGSPAGSPASVLHRMLRRTPHASRPGAWRSADPSAFRG